MGVQFKDLDKEKPYLLLVNAEDPVFVLPKSIDVVKWHAMALCHDMNMYDGQKYIREVNEMFDDDRAIVVLVKTPRDAFYWDKILEQWVLAGELERTGTCHRVKWHQDYLKKYGNIGERAVRCTTVVEVNCLSLVPFHQCISFKDWQMVEKYLRDLGITVATNSVFDGYDKPKQNMGECVDDLRVSKKFQMWTTEINSLIKGMDIFRQKVRKTESYAKAASELLIPLGHLQSAAGKLSEVQNKFCDDGIDKLRSLTGAPPDQETEVELENMVKMAEGLEQISAQMRDLSKVRVIPQQSEWIAINRFEDTVKELDEYIGGFIECRESSFSKVFKGILHKDDNLIYRLALDTGENRRIFGDGFIAWRGIQEAKP